MITFIFNSIHKDFPNAIKFHRYSKEMSDCKLSLILMISIQVGIMKIKSEKYFWIPFIGSSSIIVIILLRVMKRKGKSLLYLNYRNFLSILSPQLSWTCHKKKKATLETSLIQVDSIHLLFIENYLVIFTTCT